MTELEKVYEERARVVLALARACKRAGMTVGFGKDSAEPDWPVLFIDLPTGQVSWHIRASEASKWGNGLPMYTKPWDGHTTEEKYERLHRWGYPDEKAE